MHQGIQGTEPGGRLCAQGEQWKKTTLMTALLYPGVVFSIFFSCNLLVWGQKSSGAGTSSDIRQASSAI